MTAQKKYLYLPAKGKEKNIKRGVDINARSEKQESRFSDKLISKE